VVAAIKIDKRQVEKLQKVMNASPAKLTREVTIAINETQKKTLREVVKPIAGELAVAQKVIKTSIKGKRSKQKELRASVTVVKTARISLREFKPKQNKKGVAYKISKTRGRKFIPSGFQGPKPGVIKVSWRGNVFKREGKSRLPIHKKSGPSVWGVYVKSNKDRSIRKEAQRELSKQIQRRIRFQKLKQSGAI
jgi:hypothetical protein